MVFLPASLCKVSTAIDVALSLQFSLATAQKYLFPGISHTGSSRCFAVRCSSSLQAQIEIAPRPWDGFLQLFEDHKSARRQAGGISSSRGTGCKTLLLAWPAAAKHALPRNQANGYYAVKRETSWTYHAEGKRGIRSKWDAEVFCSQKQDFSTRFPRLFRSFFFSIRFNCRLSASVVIYPFYIKQFHYIFFFKSFIYSHLRYEINILRDDNRYESLFIYSLHQITKNPPAVNLADRSDHIYSLRH